MTGKTHRLILWDWNGTLQDDLHHIYECGVQRIFRTFGLACPALDDYKNEVTADFMVFYRAHGIPPEVTADDLNKIMFAGFKEKGAPPSVFPDAIATVAALHDAGRQQMLVSAYGAAKLSEAVRRNGLEPYFLEVIGDVRDKARLFADLVAVAGVRPDEVAAIGDQVEDAVAAAAVGVTPFICPRGFHTQERVEAACRDIPSIVIVASLADLLPRLS